MPSGQSTCGGCDRSPGSGPDLELGSGKARGESRGRGWEPLSGQGEGLGGEGENRLEMCLCHHNIPVFLQWLPHLLLLGHLLFLLWGCSLLLEGSPPIPPSPPLTDPLCLALLPLLLASPAFCLLPPGGPWSWAAPGLLLPARLSSTTAW